MITVTDYFILTPGERRSTLTMTAIASNQAKRACGIPTHREITEPRERRDAAYANRVRRHKGDYRDE